MHSRVWKAAAAVVAVGALMIASALASGDLEWVGWIGLFFTVAGAATLAARARTAAEVTPAPAAEPTDPFVPTRVAEQRRSTPLRPTPTVATARPTRKVDGALTRTTSREAVSDLGPPRQEGGNASDIPTEQPRATEPDPSVVELLAAVPGLGPSKQQALAVAFPTMEQLQEATVDDLTAVDRVGPKVAGRIRSLTGATIENLLSDVPGVGPSKRQALQDRFETAPRLMNATADEIAAVDGVSPAMASRIRQSLDSRR